jgi:protein-tyrosine-phosphatase
MIHESGPTGEILFVCTGNTCRSPLAEAVARQEIARLGVQCTVGSAGTGALDGIPASAFAVVVGREAGLDLGAHRSRLLTRTLVVRADLVLAMGPEQRYLARLLAPEAADRVHVLRDYAEGGNSGSEVVDPMGGDLEVYRRTLRQIQTLVGQSLRRYLTEAASRKH